jgi:cytochrome c-type protein NapB
MARSDGSDGGTLLRLLAIGAAFVVMVTLVGTYGPQLAGRHGATPEAAAPAITVTGEPIAAEADVFRMRPGMLGVAPDARRRTQAHPRTLAMFRSLRAYPGAPPRIPHGLTADEFRGTVCNSCHERGAFVARLSAYAPVTPHPEYTDCLQCHVADDRIVGISLPDDRPSSLCLQCHVPDSSPPVLVPVDWQPAAWPATGQQAMPETPPAMPHDLQLRGNCIACHIGPAGVEEIRTVHPERASCRQCHVPAAAAPQTSVFTRPLNGPAAARPGGTR